MIRILVTSMCSLAVWANPLGVGAQRRAVSYDPGHKTYVTLGARKVSCPNGFSPVPTRPDVGCVVLRHERFKLALFVAPAERGAAREAVRRIEGVVLSDGMAEPPAGYRWKDQGDYVKLSAYETGGTRLHGYNGAQRVGLAYRELTINGESLVVGHAFALGGGADAARLFEKNLGGESVLGALGETHVICSVTGEKYDDVYPYD